MLTQATSMGADGGDKRGRYRDAEYENDHSCQHCSPKMTKENPLEKTPINQSSSGYS